MQKIPSFLSLPSVDDFDLGIYMLAGTIDDEIAAQPDLGSMLELYASPQQLSTDEQALSSDGESDADDEEGVDAHGRFRWKPTLCNAVARVLDAHKEELSKLDTEMEIIRRLAQLLPEASPLTPTRLYSHLIKGRLTNHARHSSCGLSYDEVYREHCRKAGMEPRKRPREEADGRSNTSWDGNVCDWLCRLVRDHREALTRLKRGKYTEIRRLWKQAVRDQRSPTSQPPSMGALRSHLKLRTHRGSDSHCCWETWEPIMRGETKRCKIDKEDLLTDDF